MDISHSVLHYVFDKKVCSHRTNVCYKSQAFAKSSTLASSGVRENVYPNKLEMCWKILFLIICLLILFFNIINIGCYNVNDVKVQR